MGDTCAFEVVSTSPHAQSNIGGKKIFYASGGEAKADLVLELQDPTVIHTIQIINSNSTNLEIFVFNEGGNEETLLPTASMMTFGELSKHVNTNRLRFFGPDKFTKGVAEKKWKRLKVTCSTFDAQQPYGLESIQIFSTAPSSEYMAGAIADNRATMEPTVMSVQSAAPQYNNCGFKRSKSLVLPSTKQSDDNKENKTTNKTPSPPKSKPTCTSATTKRKRIIENDDYDDDPVGNVRTNYTPRSLTTTDIAPKKAQAASSRSKSLVFTPFNKILSGVIIVVSGIANPERSELRDKATEMGAEYFPDWIEPATHLVCKFTNTPKFAMAQQSGGFTVKPEWIVDCYKNKMRLPEKDYLLAEPKKGDMSSTMVNMRDWLTKFKSPLKTNDSLRSDDNKSTTSTTSKNITNTSTSTKPAKSLTFVNNARISRGSQPEEGEDIDDTASDSTEPMSELDKTDDGAPPPKMQKTDSKLGSSLSDKTEDMHINTQETVDLSGEDDTIDKQGTRKTSSKPTLLDKRASTSLPCYFSQVKAVLKGPFDPPMRSLLFRYITAYSGELEEKITTSTSHVVTNQVWSEELQQLQDKYPNVKIVRPSWVFDSHNDQKCADVSQHVVAPLV